MAAITIGITGTFWGATAETGVVLQKFDRKTNRKVKEIADNQGETALVGMYNPVADYNVDAYITLGGTTGLGIVAPGVIQALANVTSGNGVITGGVYVIDTTLGISNEDFRKISFTAKQWPLIA